ncbi:SPFH domain-containing protein [Undibacterium sp. Xuan67W]|uniref:SPFH domain-containing protein n=1 Tax=Undibacterium sp. Xuan67W TaxID=3413057 RepID=UPI003BF069B2
MSDRIKAIVQAIRSTLSKSVSGLRHVSGGFGNDASGINSNNISGSISGGIKTHGGTIIKRFAVLAVLGTAAFAVIQHPPVQTIERGDVGIRINQLTGVSEELRAGTVMAIPGIHELRRYSLLDQTYRPVKSAKANGEAPFQSIEGLSLGVDLTIRYVLDPAKLTSMSKSLPQDINGEIVEPAVQGVIYKAFTRYTVREIFSSKRQEIQQQIEAELKPKLATDGVILRSVMMGKVDLPPDYKVGMEKLLAEELESEKMRYTLELKGKQVQQTALEADAEKIRREKNAEAAASEQIIAAKAQEEAMKHVLPFKQKQIEQRQFEAEAEKISRIKTSEGSAQARIIEAAGEADSRRKLADAEAYRQDLVGKVASAQLERDGALLSKHPLLIQKTMADKLSDKISVIIAPPPADGGFIGSALLGAGKNQQTQLQAQTQAQTTSTEESQ